MTRFWDLIQQSVNLCMALRRVSLSPRTRETAPTTRMPHHRHRQESIPGIEPEADSSPSDFVRSGASPAWRGSGARAGIPAGRPSPPGFVLRLPRHASRPAAAAILAAKSALGGCSVLPDHPGFRPDNEASWWRCARDEPPEHLRDLERWRYRPQSLPVSASISWKSTFGAGSLAVAIPVEVQSWALRLQEA